MKLHLAALKIHLAHCTAARGIGRIFGITFTATGIPTVAPVPRA